MFSEPVVGERFFGRDEVLEILSKRALALKEGYRQNVALTGQSLTGKSSIILHFLRSIKEEGFIPIYVEVVREPFKFFADKFIATMLYHTLSIRGEDVGVDIETLLQQSAETFPKTSAAIKHIRSCVDEGEIDKAYAALLELTSVLKAESGTPCIVILDEFDNLEYLGIRNPFASFGKVIMVQKDTMYIVSSSRNLAIKKIISEKLSLLFGNFELIKISNFGVRGSSNFINMRLSGFDFDLHVRKFLIAFTDGNPFYLNSLLGTIKDIAIRRMTSHVDKDIMVDTAIELVYNASGTIHQYLMNYMLELVDAKSRDLHIAILIAIAEGINRHPDIARHLHVKQADVAAVLLRFSEQGLITKNGVFYTIDDAMFAFWLKHVYQRKKNLLIDGIFDKEMLFRKEMTAYISDFEHEFNLPPTDRIAELFNLFSNELVQIDGKSSKLPHFTKVETREFPDHNRYIAASFRGNYWIVQPFDRDVDENDIVAFIKNFKSINCKISNKIIIPIRGIEENAKLLAKELKITIWDSRTANMLLTLYGKKRIIAL